MKRSKDLKKTIRKIYQEKKTKDRIECGRKKNDLMQSLHLQYKLPEKDRDVSLMANCIQMLDDMKKEHRFREDFPSFNKFYNYIINPKNSFAPEDIQDL